MNKEKEENYDYETNEGTYEFASMQDKEQSVKNITVPFQPKENKGDD